MNTNRYCERLAIPRPAVERFIGRHDMSLLRLIVLALLEHGGPLSMEEIADRLVDAGVCAPSGDMLRSLRKAWHGLPPVVKEPDGTMGLDLESWELKHLAWELGRETKPAAEAPPAPLAAELPGDHVPLREEEVRDALASEPGLSNVRTAAAVLDLHGDSLAFGKVKETVERLTGKEWRPHRPFARSRLFSEASEGVLRPGEASELRTLRRVVRAAARQVRELREREDREARARAARQQAREEEQRRETAEASRLRKALVWSLPRGARPVVVSILDLRSREIRSLTGSMTAEAAAALRHFDVVYGLDVRETLAGLGLDALDFRLFDLRPPRKSIRLNRAGKTLRVTPELVIASSTGLGHPLADPVKVAQYVAEGDTRKLVRRAESDVKALYAYYRYGLLHGHVRLDWGFVHEAFGVDWALPDDESLVTVLRKALAEGRAVDVVVGSSPGWNDPWSRARRWRVLAMDYGSAVLEGTGVRQEVSLGEIQAVRLAGDSAESLVTP